jgi:hypothetical protein
VATRARFPALPLRLAAVRLAAVGLAAVGLAAVTAGCASAPPKDPAGPAPAIRLVATLTSPTDVALRWTGADPGAAGRSVEFATSSEGPYTVLQFVPPNQTTYTHPDLMPQTTFYYRVRSVYGPATPAVDVVLPEGGFDENTHRDDPDWAAPRALPHPGVAQQAIRNPATAAAAAPTDLKATVADANGIRFTWTDHASDEEGYLIEVRPAGSADFGVAAVLDPDITSFGLFTMPNEKRASYRVRAFYYGASSNIAHQTTGQDQTGQDQTGQEQTGQEQR